MSIENPIGGGPRDPYEKYRQYQIDPIDREKHEKGQKGKRPEGDPKKPLPPGAVFLLLLQQMIDYLLSFAKGSIASHAEKEACDNLQQLKQHFTIMALENRSQDIEFLNTLSHTWHRALELSVRFKRADAFSIAFRSLVKKIQNYPENQEHTLGYYLSEYTGEKWLPFPYMELIQKIHEQYNHNPVTSDLSLWIQELDQLIVACSS